MKKLYRTTGLVAVLLLLAGGCIDEELWKENLRECEPEESECVGKTSIRICETSYRWGEITECSQRCQKKGLNSQGCHYNPGTDKFECQCSKCNCQTKGEKKCQNTSANFYLRTCDGCKWKTERCQDVCQRAKLGKPTDCHYAPEKKHDVCYCDPPTSQKLGFGQKCLASDNKCESGICILYNKEARYGYCTKSCSNTNQKCSGAPAGTMSFCVKLTSSSKRCVFYCKYKSGSKWRYHSCPSSLHCNSTPASSGVYLCVP